MNLKSYMNIKKILKSKAPVLVAFSGGKDSVAMVLYLLEQGVPKERIHLHHHDVDGHGDKLFDWSCTTSYCQSFADHFGLKLFFSFRLGGLFRSIYRNNEPLQDIYFQKVPGGEFHLIASDKKAINTRMKFPAVSASLSSRWCSAEVKIDVLRRVIAHNPEYSNEIFILTGERRQESANRAKYEETELHATSGKKRIAISWRPIIDWTEEQVWEIMKFWKVQPHPAYMLGWSRCSCQLCIFGSPDIWASINAISPEKVDVIDQTENNINFTLYNNQSIREKVASGTAFKMDPFWVSQATGEFTAPMIVDEWILPAGAFRKESAGSL